MGLEGRKSVAFGNLCHQRQVVSEPVGEMTTLAMVSSFNIILHVTPKPTDLTLS
jgi:hypothetical protein